MSAAELHHRPTPAGLLTDALGPVTFDGLEVITRVVDRLGVDLTAELSDLVRMAMTRAVNRALTSRPALVIVDDELAYEARARIGYLSAPAAGEVVAEGHESAAERFGEDTRCRHVPGGRLMPGPDVLFERHEIDLMTGWCSIHESDCGPQVEFEARAYQAEPELERPVLEARRCLSIHVHDSHDWSWGGQSFTCPGVSDG